jgi:hypothetical protein
VAALDKGVNVPRTMTPKWPDVQMAPTLLAGLFALCLIAVAATWLRGSRLKATARRLAVDLDEARINSELLDAVTD